MRLKTQVHVNENHYGKLHMTNLVIIDKSCQKTSAETKTTGTNYSICMEQTSFITSKCET